MKSRIFTSIVALVLLISTTYFEAFAVDLYESENNNTVQNADVTYDDYNNYGTLSSTNDTDWWKITFSQTGYANFWLGNVPSSVAYFLTLFESDGSQKIAESTNITPGGAQLIRAKVYAGVTYTIRIAEWNGYSPTQQYLFRAKIYTTQQEARIYTVYDYKNETINFRENVPKILPYMRSMGFHSGERYNYTAVNFFNELDDINMAVITTHGQPGKFAMGNDSRFVANDYTYGYSDYSGLGLYPDLALIDLRLICYESCQSGSIEPDAYYYGNLIDESLNLGAHCALGWKQSFYHGDILKWNDFFFGNLNYGQCIGEAIENARLSLVDNSIEYSSITSIYYGSSPVYSITLG